MHNHVKVINYAMYTLAQLKLYHAFLNLSILLHEHCLIASKVICNHWSCTDMLLKSSFFMSRQVSIEEAEAKSRERNVMFIETSAKAGFNIKVANFNQFTRSIC